MERHLRLVPAGADFADAEPSAAEGAPPADTNVVDFESERTRRRRYHPSAGADWIDELFDDDPLDPVC